MALTPEHAALLTAQAISENTAEKFGVTSVTHPDQVPETIPRWFVVGPGRGPGLLFWWDVPGRETPEPQFRPDVAVTDDDGKPHKYIFAKGCGSFTGRLREPEGDASVLVVEGTKQSLAAYEWAPPSWGVYGVPGCQNWKGSDLSWADGRNVVVLFDGDVNSNRDVYDAAEEFREALTGEGAELVSFAKLTNARAKDGLDDVLGRMNPERRTRYLELAVKNAKGKLGRPPARKPDNPYFDKRGGLMAKTTAEAVLDGQPAALAAGSMIALYRDGAFRVNQGKEPLYDAVQRLLGEEYRPNWRQTVEESLIGLLHGQGLYLPERASEPLLNCPNGMLDLRTGALDPHSPVHLSRVQVAVAWDPEAVCPVYEEWLGRSCPGQTEDLEETASTMLDMSRTPSKALFLFGPSRSGKSTFLRLMKSVAGVSNMSAVDLHQLEDDRFATANLYGKMLNSCADLSAAHLSDTSKFKQATGGDVLHANRKYGHEFSFTNTALFAFSANKIPTVSESSRAYLERIKPFSFPFSFAGQEDLGLEEKLTAELPGILRRWVLAWQRREARGGPMSTDPQVLRAFEAASDRVNQWSDHAALVHPEAVGKLVGADQGTGKTELYQAFKAWLTAEGGAVAMKRGDFLHRLESLQGVGEVRLRDRNKNIGLNVTVCLDGEKDKSRVLIGEETNHHEQVVLKSGECGFPLTPPIALTVSADDHGMGVDRVIDMVGVGRKSHSTLAHTTPDLVTQGEVGFDLETADAGKLYTGGHNGPFVRLAGLIEDSQPDGVTGPSPESLTASLESAPVIYGHNILGFDLQALARHHGVDYMALASKAVDTLVLARLMDPPGAKGMKPWGTRGYYGLDAVAQRLGVAGKTHDLKALAKLHGGYDLIPVDDGDYNAYLRGDLTASRAVYERLTEGGLSDYARREMRVVALQNLMSVNGCLVDTELLASRVQGEAQARQGAVDALASEAGLPVTPGSRKPWTSKAGKEALVAALADAGAPHIPRTATGAPRLSKDALGEGRWMDHTGESRPGLLSVYGHLPGVRRIVDLVLTASGAADKYAEIAEYVTAEGRVHPEVGDLQGSGRWAYVRPSLTNVGKRGRALEQREVITAGPGNVIMAFDFDQVDMRAVAGHSGDRAYAALFEPGRDAHSEVADAVFGRHDGDWRDKAKAIGHGWNYGRGVKAISESNGLPLEMVQVFDATMRERFPRLMEWKAEVAEAGSAGHLLDNGYGRLMRCDPLRSYTQAPALMGQGGARDIMCEGLLRLPSELWPMLRLVVHDEAVLEVPEADVEDVSRMVRAAFTMEFRGIPVTVGASKPGKNWRDCYRK